MKLNTLEKLYDCMENLAPRVELNADLMRRARALRMRATGLALTASDRTGGPADRVVGYGAFAFEYPGHARLSDAERADLFATAATCLRFAAERGGATPPLGLRPRLSAAELRERMRRRSEAPRPEPAVWIKTDYAP